MPAVSLDEWRAFLTLHPDAHLLQSAEWGELKAAFAWQPLRIVEGSLGVQVLFRRLPLGLTLAYLPKPIFEPAAPVSNVIWWQIIAACRQRRAVFLKLEP